MSTPILAAIHATLEHLPLGQRIRTLRQALGWNQAALAVAVEVSRVCVSDWERGRKVPHPRNRKRLAEVFDVPPVAMGFNEKKALRPLAAGRLEPQPS